MKPLKNLLSLAVLLGLGLFSGAAHAQNAGFSSMDDYTPFSGTYTPSATKPGTSYTVFGTTAHTQTTNFMGPVGINMGTSAPQATLDVNGPLRATTPQIVIGLTCSPEGAMGYDTTNHTPVYCNQGALWSVMGSSGFGAAERFTPTNGTVYPNKTGAPLFLSSDCPNSPFASGFLEAVTYYVYNPSGAVVEVSHGQIQEGGKDANLSASPYASAIVPPNYTWSISTENAHCATSVVSSSGYSP